MKAKNKPIIKRIWARIMAFLTLISIMFSAFGDIDQRTQTRTRIRPVRVRKKN